MRLRAGECFQSSLWFQKGGDNAEVLACLGQRTGRIPLRNLGSQSHPYDMVSSLLKYPL
jgi:hypothetical protein